MLDHEQFQHWWLMLVRRCRVARTRVVILIGRSDVRNPVIVNLRHHLVSLLNLIYVYCIIIGL
jgi:hypothetical protein